MRGQAHRRRVALLIVGSPQTAASGDDDEEEAEVREVVRLVSLLAVPASLFQLFDGLLGVSSGILRGCGRQGLLAVAAVLIAAKEVAEWAAASPGAFDLRSLGLIAVLLGLGLRRQDGANREH